MRLNAKIREDIVNAAMRDVPNPQKGILDRLKPKLLKFYLDRLPAAARPLWDSNPEIFETRLISVGARSSRLQVKVPSHEYDLPHKKEPWFRQAENEIEDAEVVRREARGELIQAVKSVNTAKRLREVYPDLAKYLPSDISGQALAVPQSLPKLHAAGWPKRK